MNLKIIGVKMEPLTHSIYKGKTGKYGAIQFRFIRPHYKCFKCKERNYKTYTHPDGSSNCDGNMKQKEGVVLAEITSSTGPDTYDWDNKITMALSLSDLSKIILALQKNDKCQIFHDPNMNTSLQSKIMKTFALNPGKNGGFFVQVSQKDSSGQKIHKIPLLADEVLTIRIIFTSLLSKMLAWS
jgi:hypothetical protein